MVFSGFNGRDIFNFKRTTNQLVKFQVGWGNAAASLRWFHSYHKKLYEIIAGAETILGYTSIPNVIEIDTIFWQTEISEDKSDTDLFVTFEFNDGPEQNNYRLGI